MRSLCLAAVVVAIAAGSNACASRKFVRSSVGTTNEKVKELVERLEETQMRTARNERRIAEVDEKAGRASRTAAEARTAASGAAAAARAAGSRLHDIETAANRLVFDVAMTANEAGFGIGDVQLSRDARVRLDRMVHELIDDPANVFIEIEGHTDDRGADAANMKLGLARALAVQKYLYEVHQVPLHRMNVISFGKQKPIAPNATEAGRAKNRRVVIRIRA